MRVTGRTRALLEARRWARQVTCAAAIDEVRRSALELEGRGLFAKGEDGRWTVTKEGERALEEESHGR